MTIFIIAWVVVMAAAFTEQVVFWNKIIGNDCNRKVSK